jgi:outer membrane scaffolding protein for murein synthesis (MipA/OmpV family)
MTRVEKKNNRRSLTSADRIGFGESACVGYRARYAALAVLAMSLLCSVADSQEIVRVPMGDEPEGTPGLGGLLRVGHQNYLGEPSRTDLIPLYLYEGRYIFAHGTSFGVHALRNEWFSFDLLGRMRLNRMLPADIPELQGLIEREHSLDAGASLGLRGRFGELQFTAVQDVLDRHDGQELDLSYRFPIRRGRWTITPWVSLIQQDENLTAYYYGVSPIEATPDRPAYVPGEAQNLAYGINTSFRMNDRFFMFANVGVDEFDDTITASPIVDSSNNVRLMAGAAYLFAAPNDPRIDSVDESGVPVDRPRWTWRVHWAYQIHQNIFPLGMAGVWNPSRLTPDVTPKQVGLSLGRILRRGEQLDVIARLAVFRHFEEPFQPEFNSYSASLGGMFNSYSRRTNRVAMRWGLQFGMSYVDEAPGQEVQKFINREVQWSSLLGYLEFQVDFALDNLIRRESLEGCFVGLIVTHRSGIFGNSELFGDVDGGSDWGGFHLECQW